MNKKLICLNLVILLTILLFSNYGYATEVNNEYEKYIIIDGVEYDATLSASGVGWKYNLRNGTGFLNLLNYNGGSIYANVDLYIHVDLTNYPEMSVTADSGYGIFVDGNLSFISGMRNNKGEFLVRGANNHEAIYATGDLSLVCVTAIGENCPAVFGKHVSISDSTTVFVGENEETSFIGEYTNQSYLKIAPLNYEHKVTFDGNGGRTSCGQTDYVVKFLSPTPASLQLNDYSTVFKNGEKRFLGWEDAEGNFCKYCNYSFDAYSFETTLYALWEDENQKAVYLNNYYMDYNYKERIEMTGGTVVEAVKVGENFVLPILSRAGYTFDGWISADNSLKKPGDIIKITETISLTAKYSVNKDVLVIGGKEYDAGEYSGNYGLGWHYYPGEPAQLDIEENYSGLPIIVPGNVRIYLNGNVSGNESNPAILVYGSADIYACGDRDGKNVQITGCGEQPAIKADGEIYISGALDEDDSFIIEGGNADVPAIVAPKVAFYDYFFYSGSNYKTLTIVGSYNNEHILKLVPNGHLYLITVPKGGVVPTPVKHNDYTFVGWEVASAGSLILPDSNVWYMPGDVVGSDVDVGLKAVMLNNWSSRAVVLNGNGGHTEQNSKYYIDVVSRAFLSLYEIPDNPFDKVGYNFEGYNSEPDGMGQIYNPGDSFQDYGETYIYNLYAQWKKTNVCPIECEVDKIDTGYRFDIVLNKDEISEFETANIVVALYDEYGKNIKIAQAEISKLDTTLKLDVETDGDATTAKVMLWQSLSSIKPLCNLTEILIE